MINAQKSTMLKKDFDARSKVFASLKDEAVFALESALTTRAIKYNSIPARVKEFQSFWIRHREKSSISPLCRSQISWEYE